MIDLGIHHVKKVEVKVVNFEETDGFPDFRVQKIIATDAEGNVTTINLFLDKECEVLV